MVNRDLSDPKAQNVFRVHHIASFVEGEHSLKPEEVVRHLKALQSSKRIEETPCMMKLDNRGIRIKLEQTKETVESFEWNGIRNQAAVLNPMDNFQFRYLVFFRLFQAKEKISELHVFSCETTSEAKSFVDSMSYHKNRNIKEGVHADDGVSKVPLRRGRSETKINTVVDAYGQHFYMLNRCIDDIESFERRLEKAIKKRANPKGSDESSRQPVYKTPSTSEFVEAVRKVKYAFNTNEAIRPYTPDRTSRKIFIRLFNTVHWLDEVCKSGCVPEYHAELVSDVVEPLLNEDTIRAIMERLVPKKQEFWRSLGKAWNTPSEQWPNPCNRYMPQFDSPISNERPKRFSSYEKPGAAPPVFRSPSMGAINEHESIKIHFHREPHNAHNRQSPIPKVKSPPMIFSERNVITAHKPSDVDEPTSPPRVILNHGPSVSQSIVIQSPPPLVGSFTERPRSPTPVSTQAPAWTSPSGSLISRETKQEPTSVQSPPAVSHSTTPVHSSIPVHSSTPVHSTVPVRSTTPVHSTVPAHSTVPVHSSVPTVPPASMHRSQDDVSKTRGNSGALYCVTIRHVSAKAREISVSPGTVVEVLDKSQIDWWIVKDPNGSEGEIPKWKLKPYTGAPQTQPNRSSLGALQNSHKIIVPNRSTFIDDRTSTQPVSTAPSSNPLTGSAIRSPVFDEDHTAITPSISHTTGAMPPTEQPAITTQSMGNHMTSPSITLSPSEPKTIHTATESNQMPTERVISVNKLDDSASLTTQSQQTGPSGNMLYMTSDQLQEIMKSSENLSQVPMVLLPVSEFYKYASQSNLNVNAMNGAGQQAPFGTIPIPMQWPDLHELGTRPGSPGLTGSTGLMSEWKPAPLVPSGSLEGIGFSPYPFNYPTHMHTMTRELRERLSKMREGGGSGLKSVPAPTTSNEKAYSRLTKYASKDDIAEWLVARRFPPTVISNLKGFNGMDLYTMSRQQLAQHVGPERCDEIFYAFRGS